MKRKNVLSMLISTAIILMTTICSAPAYADFRYSKDGTCKYYENETYVTGWKLLDGKWYYFDQNGNLEKEKWIKYKDKWYYIDYYGIMTQDMVVDGYYINKDGEWTGSKDKSLLSSEAEDVIYKNDGAFLKKQLQKQFIKLIGPEDFTYNELYESWNLENQKRENYYRYAVMYTSEDGKEYYEDEYSYLVGKSTGNVYIVPHQGCLPMYQVSNNEVIKKFNWSVHDDYYDYDWRNDL